MSIRTDRDAFEFIRSKLIEQNETSLNPDGECSYRGFSENRILELTGKNRCNADTEVLRNLKTSQSDISCAVGHLIKDEFYTKSLEGYGCNDQSVILAIKSSNPEWVMDYRSLLLLAICQETHDMNEPGSWRNMFSDDRFTFDDNDSFLITDENREEN